MAFTSQSNPVLSAFRRHVEIVGTVNTPQLAQEWLDHFPHYWRGFRNGAIARKSHRMHARKVFRKLAAL